MINRQRLVWHLVAICSFSSNGARKGENVLSFCANNTAQYSSYHWPLPFAKEDWKSGRLPFTDGAHSNSRAPGRRVGSHLRPHSTTIKTCNYHILYWVHPIEIYVLSGPLVFSLKQFYFDFRSTCYCTNV
jgi:hypothetical protein